MVLRQQNPLGSKDPPKTNLVYLFFFLVGFGWLAGMWLDGWFQFGVLL